MFQATQFVSNEVLHGLFGVMINQVYSKKSIVTP